LASDRLDRWFLAGPDTPGGDVHVRHSADGGVTFTMSFTVQGGGEHDRQLRDARWLCDVLNGSDRQRAWADDEIVRLRDVVRKYEEAAPELLAPWPTEQKS
jgi:hypothetical protein